MGGDLGPSEVVLGIAKSSAINPEARFIIHGDLPTLSKLVEVKSIRDKCRIVDAKDIVSMDQKPSYMKDVPRVLKYINTVLDRNPVLRDLKELVDRAEILT